MYKPSFFELIRPTPLFSVTLTVPDFDGGVVPVFPEPVLPPVPPVLPEEVVPHAAA